LFSGHDPSNQKRGVTITYQLDVTVLKKALLVIMEVFNFNIKGIFNEE